MSCLKKRLIRPHKSQKTQNNNCGYFEQLNVPALPQQGLLPESILSNPHGTLCGEGLSQGDRHILVAFVYFLERLVRALEYLEQFRVKVAGPIRSFPSTIIRYAMT